MSYGFGAGVAGIAKDALLIQCEFARGRGYIEQFFHLIKFCQKTKVVIYSEFNSIPGRSGSNFSSGSLNGSRKGLVRISRPMVEA